MEETPFVCSARIATDILRTACVEHSFNLRYGFYRQNTAEKGIDSSIKNSVVRRGLCVLSFILDHGQP